MPAALGGLRRTNDRIAEATGATGSEKDSEDLEGEEAASSEDKKPAPTQENPKDNKEVVSAKDAGVERLDSKDDEIVSKSPVKNRDSRSTVGTHSSVDLSSTASADSTTPSSIPGFGSARTSHATSEPRSAMHSATNSLSIFGPLHQGPMPHDFAEAMQRLCADTMNVNQCLVTFTPVQSDVVRTLHPNGSSTSLASDPYHRHTFPSMPASSPMQQMGQSLDSLGSAQSPFGNNAFTQSRSSLSSLVPSSSMTNLPQSSRQGPKKTHYNFHLSGSMQQVMAARGQILRDHPFRSRLSIKVPRNDLVDSGLPLPTSTQNLIPSDYLKPEVRIKLEETSVACNCVITVVSHDHHAADLGHGLETERLAEIVIAGAFEGAEQARTHVMVMLDELNGLHVEACEIDYKLHNIIGGRKRCLVQTIQEETATNIYMPTPFSGVFSTNRSTSLAARQNTLYITGEFFGVQRARDMLYQVSTHKSKSIISRNTAVWPRKIDWLLTERLEEIRSIMIDNASFISMPLLGSQTSVITVYGDSRVSIERTIRSVMQLACQFFIASLWLLPISFDGHVASNTLTAHQVPPLIKHISAISGAEVAFRGNCFEIHGLETEVKQAVVQLLELDVLKSFNFEINFQIELANEHREFISGKKNGKINKIMKQGIRVKFETFNDYNFLIDVSSNDRASTMQGLNLLLEELPAEMSFHIPENYHKRIIGVGGKNIQKTMKKFGVYVKFYSKQDLDMETYPFLETEDNVIARTPAKNAVNLENLKAAVMELVTPKDKDFVSENVQISRRYHRTLLGEKGIFIHDIESKLGCLIRFPPPESASDLVSIFGPESQIHIAAQMLLDHVPCEAEYRTPSSSELTRILGSHEFVALIERVKRDLNINIVPVHNRSQAPASSAVGGEVVFKLRLNRSSADFLPAAKDALEDFLISRNINVYTHPDRTRADSFASSFPHFANKLISSVPQAGESTESFQTDSAARYRQQQAQETNRLRAAASTPDIKALFDSPTVGSGPFLPSNASSNMQMGVPNSHGTAHTMLPNNIYSSPYPESLRPTTSGLGSGDVWGAPSTFAPSAPTANAAVNMSHTSPAHSGIAFPQHVPRMSDDVKMLSNARTESRVQGDQLDAIRKPRAYSHRAQSLDIGALAAQQVVHQATSGSGANQPSPTHSITNSLPGGVSADPHTPGFSPVHRSLGAIGSGPSTMSTSSHAGGNSHSFSGMPQGFPIGSLGNSSIQTQHVAHHSMPSPFHTQQAPYQFSQPTPSQQYTSHHMPSPSITRLGPSAAQRALEPETADEVLRSLAQLNFTSSG